MSFTKEQAVAALRTVLDPELHKDIVTLNMVKDVQVDGDNVGVTVELTTPACPLKENSETKMTNALMRAGAANVKVNLTANARGPAQPKRDVLPQVKNIV